MEEKRSGRNCPERIYPNPARTAPHTAAHVKLHVHEDMLKSTLSMSHGLSTVTSHITVCQPLCAVDVSCNRQLPPPPSLPRTFTAVIILLAESQPSHFKPSFYQLVWGSDTCNIFSFTCSNCNRACQRKKVLCHVCTHVLDVYVRRVIVRVDESLFGRLCVVHIPWPM